MNYDNSKIRRQDRLLDEARAEQLLRDSQWGVLSLCDADRAYGIPVNFVWDGLHTIYIHCAPEGRKLNAIALCCNISFCVVGNTHVISDHFTTSYESVVVQGTASVPLNDGEKMKALEMILDKYSPEDKAVGLKYAEKSFHRTEIIRIDITSASGKCKKVQ